MKKLLQLIGLSVFALLNVMLWQGKIYARVTGTVPPTSADVFCVGPAALEVCVDSGANLVPTTTGVGSLGIPLTQWKNISASGYINLGSSITATAFVSTNAVTSRLHIPVASTQALNVATFADAGDLFLIPNMQPGSWVLCVTSGTGQGAVIRATGTVSGAATPCRDIQ